MELFLVKWRLCDYPRGDWHLQFVRCNSAFDAKMFVEHTWVDDGAEWEWYVFRIPPCEDEVPTLPVKAAMSKNLYSQNGWQ